LKIYNYDGKPGRLDKMSHDNTAGFMISTPYDLCTLAYNYDQLLNDQGIAIFRSLYFYHQTYFGHGGAINFDSELKPLSTTLLMYDEKKKQCLVYVSNKSYQHGIRHPDIHEVLEHQSKKYV
jgi:hypothetical protein